MKRLPRFWSGFARIALVVAVVNFAGCMAAWRPQPRVAQVATLPASALEGEGREITLRLATWNVWGLPFGTPQRAERIRSVAAAVAAARVDVVCFQEVFLEADRRILCETLARAGLRHFRYFASPPAGSGLLTVSRYPIRETAFLRFAQQGNPFAFQHLDWWAGKGAGLVVLDVPGFGEVRVFNTHLHARYRGDHYRSLRQIQVRELFGMVGKSADSGSPVFLLGDLNHRMDDPFWSSVLQAARLQSVSKPWSPIDYIFVAENEGFRVKHSEGSPLRGKLPDGHTKLSDHTGIVTEVRISRTQ